MTEVPSLRSFRTHDPVASQCVVVDLVTNEVINGVQSCDADTEEVTTIEGRDTDNAPIFKVEKRKFKVLDFIQGKELFRTIELNVMDGLRIEEPEKEMFEKPEQEMPKQLMQKRELPRRCYADLQTPAEKSLRASMNEVIKLGTDPKLMEALKCLKEAYTVLADFVDNTSRTECMDYAGSECPIPDTCTPCMQPAMCIRSALKKEGWIISELKCS